MEGFKTIGAVEAALQPLREAEQRFQALVDAGSASSEGMIAAAICEAAECLIYLGQYDEAATVYEEGIRRAERINNRRTVAVGRANLGTVRLYQKRYGQALESCLEALQIFESLGEPGSVAASWHQIGRTHFEAGQFDQTEQAYRQSLAIWVQQQNRTGEAANLTELGNLYDRMGRLEEAATFCRQAVEIYARLQNTRYEGIARVNLANTLIKLQRYDEGRGELYRAIECIKPFGHVAEPWKAWNQLHNLEQATGNAPAARVARGQAIASYLAYRRAGGESQSNQAQLFPMVFQAIQQGATTEAEQYLDKLSSGVVSASGQGLVVGLRAILRGDRDPALAGDPALDYRNAAELQLLLEALGSR